jgi:CHAT domain-containing protein
VLVAGVPQAEATPVQNLPHTVDEVRDVATILPARAVISLPRAENVLVDDSSSGIKVATALNHLPESHIVHLACHGLQNPDAPLESGFILQDGVLTISKLMPTPLPNAFFAFLSACDTAKGDAKYREQALHLASAMLFAGFKSIIATLWSVSVYGTWRCF